MQKLNADAVRAAKELLLRVKPSEAFIPNGKQEEFMRAVGAGSFRHYGLLGGNGCGKTAVLANILCQIILGKHGWFADVPGLPLFEDWPYPKVAWLLGTHSNLKDGGAIYDNLRKYFPPGKFTDEKQGKEYPSVYKFPGYDWTIRAWSYDQDPKEVEGPTVGLVISDEPMPEGFRGPVLSRLRGGGIYIAGMTPLDGAPWIVDLREEGTPNWFFMDVDVEDACFGENTEILTSEGWVNCASVTMAHTVATMRMEGLSLEYQHPIAVTHNPSKLRDMVILGRTQIAVTPDHQMLVLTEGGDNGKRLRRKNELRPKFIRADQMYRGQRLYSRLNPVQNREITLQSPFPDKISADDWCEFMGWYISEGCCVGVNGGKNKRYTVFITQKNERKREEIRALLQRTGWKWGERKHDFYCNDKALHAHLFVLGNSQQKRIPRYMYGYSDHALTLFWNTLLKGDGDGKFRYCTSSPQLADDVQELLLRLGYRTSIGMQSGGEITQGEFTDKIYYRKDMFQTRALKPRHYHVDQFPVVAYEGGTHCVEVPNGTVVVRDALAKRPLITGNCRTHGVRGHLEHKEIEAMIESFPAFEREARKTGKPLAYSGRVYPDWGEENLVDEGERGISWLLENDKDAPTIYMVLDPHDTKPWVMTWWAVYRNGRKVCFMEWPDREQPMYHETDHVAFGYDYYVELIRRKERRLRVYRRIIDERYGYKSVLSKGGLTSIAQEIRKASNGELRFIPSCGQEHDNRNLVQQAILPRKVFSEAEKIITLEPTLLADRNCRNFDYAMRHHVWKRNTGKALDTTTRFQQQVSDKNKCFPNTAEYFLGANPRWVEPGNWLLSEWETDEIRNLAGAGGGMGRQWGGYNT